MFCCSPKDIRKLSLCAIVLLILLRVSIGWQFFYEGVWKLGTLKTREPWSAAGYLKNAKGPFRTTFRNMVGDPYDFDKLNLEKMSARLSQWQTEYKAHFAMNEDQANSLDALVKDAQAKLKQTMDSPLWVGKPEEQRVGEVEVYRGMIQRYESKLKRVKVDFQQRHLDHEWAEIEGKRKELTGTVEAIFKDLETAAETTILTPEQLNQGPLPQPVAKVDSINHKTIWALTILGFCMMVGLFSRTAAVGTAVMLAMFYLVMPPWPGVPEAPGPEHSLIVNKNFIEFLACLALAALPTGRWLGLDSLIHRFILRGKTD